MRMGTTIYTYDELNRFTLIDYPDETPDVMYYYDGTNDGARCTGKIIDPYGCVLGDLNGDGGRNVLDIVTMVHVILSQTPATDATLCAGDLNRDSFCERSRYCGLSK